MLKFIILGAIQGITEFLPVSSSGHLTIAQYFLGLNKDLIFLDTILHLGTILALFTFFARDIIAAFKNPKTILNIAIVTIFTGAIGLTFKHTFESFFSSVRFVSAFLIVNGLILILTKYIKDQSKNIRTRNAVIMGIAQGLAITPGISRSGSTIAALLFCGIKREEAFRFSFLASIPAIIGAFIFEAKDMNPFQAFPLSHLAIGILTAYLTGVGALIALSKMIRNNKFYLFGPYCILLGTGLLIFLAR